MEARRLRRTRPDHQVSQRLDFLSWGADEIHLGSVSPEGCKTEPVTLDWLPGDVRNCSYAADRGWIGITAEDRRGGGQVLAMHDPLSQTNRILIRVPAILHHAFNRAGTAICYTQPQRPPTGAALYRWDVEGGRSHRLGAAVAAYDSTPSWFPDGAHIAYAAPDGTIEVVDLVDDGIETLTEGSACAVHPDGKQLALRRADRLFLHTLAAQTDETRALAIRRRWLEYNLTSGLSWSPDGRYLSFGVVSGLVGKATTFQLLDLALGTQTRIDGRYLRGLVLI